MREAGYWPLFGDVPFGQHSLMEDSANDDCFGALTIEDDVLSLADAAAAGLECITRAANQGRFDNLLNAILKLGDVTDGLIRAPFLNRVSGYCF